MLNTHGWPKIAVFGLKKVQKHLFWLNQPKYTIRNSNEWGKTLIQPKRIPKNVKLIKRIPPCTQNQLKKAVNGPFWLFEPRERLKTA